MKNTIIWPDQLRLFRNPWLFGAYFFFFGGGRVEITSHPVIESYRYRWMNFPSQEIHGILCGGASSRKNLSSDGTKPLVIFIVYIENDYTTQLKNIGILIISQNKEPYKPIRRVFNVAHLTVMWYFSFAPLTVVNACITTISPFLAGGFARKLHHVLNKSRFGTSILLFSWERASPFILERRLSAPRSITSPGV